MYYSVKWNRWDLFETFWSTIVDCISNERKEEIMTTYVDAQNIWAPIQNLWFLHSNRTWHKIFRLLRKISHLFHHDCVIYVAFQCPNHQLLTPKIARSGYVNFRDNFPKKVLFCTPWFLAFLSILCFLHLCAVQGMLCWSRFYFVFAKRAIFSHYGKWESPKKYRFFWRNKEISDQQGMRKGYTSVKNQKMSKQTKKEHFFGKLFAKMPIICMWIFVKNFSKKPSFHARVTFTHALRMLYSFVPWKKHYLFGLSDFP